MGFLAPLMLIGSAAASIPLILHFFYRARYKPIDWGAMKFLKLAMEQTSRRLKFQEIVLLLLRILLLLLLAIALARPTSCTSMSGTGRGQSVDAIFVFDLSFSMNTREGTRTRLDIAKERALKVIDELPPNSTVQVIGCANQAVGMGPRSPGNLDQARLLIQNMKATQRATDFLPGLEEALIAMDRTQGASKEIYLFSDMQRTGWENQSAAIRGKCEEIKARGTFFLIHTQSDELRNVSIIDLRTQTDIPNTRQRLPFIVTLKNTGTVELRNLTVSLRVDGAETTADSQPVERIGPGEVMPVTLTAKIDKAGWRVLTATIGSGGNDESNSKVVDLVDSLADDNRLDKAIMVRDTVKILVVDGRPDDRDPEKGASYFIGHALLPIPEELRPNYHIQPKIIKATNVSAGDLTGMDVCVMVDCPLQGPTAVPEDFVKYLPDFVGEGHGLLITTGDNTVPEIYNRVLGSGGANLLPATMKAIFTAPEDQPIFPDPNSIALQSFLGKFRSTSNDPFLQIRDAQTAKAVEVEEPADVNSGQVMLRYNNNMPALLSKQLRLGEVLLLTTSADRQWGYFATNLTFQPFVHGAMTHLIERSAQTYNLICGKPIAYQPKVVNIPYEVIRPDGERQLLGKPEPSLTVGDTSLAGIYTILPQDDQQGGARFAVIADPEEYQALDAMPEDQIDTLLGFRPQHIKDSLAPDVEVESIRNRNEWTVLALGLLLILAVFEAGWAWFCGKAW
ncbi:MAG: BatA domain-containing protein [Zavarzinella sp.]